MSRLRRLWSKRPPWVVTVLLTLAFLLFADIVITPIAGEVAALSDSWWWVLTAWVIIGFLWTYMIPRISRKGTKNTGLITAPISLPAWHARQERRTFAGFLAQRGARN